jgi:carbonic anhydrase
MAVLSSSVVELNISFTTIVAGQKSVPDFEKSLRYDLDLLRSSPAVPKQVKLYGFFYEINSAKLIEVARDIPALTAV